MKYYERFTLIHCEMAKRFTDTDKWKKPFIRALDAPYKLLWFYILDDCDHAGIWQVDFEVAQIRIGQQVNEADAIKIFGDRVEIFHEGKKWFLRDFVTFQYGQLTEKNRLHQSVLNLLNKNNLDPYKPLTRGQGQGTIQGIEQGKGKGKGEGEFENEIFEDWVLWGKLIVDDLDQNWHVIKGRKVSMEEMDSFLSVATRNKWKMDTQGEFRISLNGFKPTGNGQGIKSTYTDQKERMKNL